MAIRIKRLTEKAILPKYVRAGDAGMDLYATEKAIIQPGERKIIGTGIAMAIPNGNVGLIWDRSGLAVKQGLKSLGGVIDSNYRGEIKVVLHNLSQETFSVEEGMRVAQILIQPIEQKELLEVKELDETERGAEKFGSSGLN